MSVLAFFFPSLLRGRLPQEDKQDRAAQPEGRPHVKAIRALGVGGALQHCPGLGSPSGAAGHQVAGMPSAVFMSALFHVELHLIEKRLWSDHEVSAGKTQEGVGTRG